MKKHVLTLMAGLLLIDAPTSAGTNPNAVRLTGNNVPAHAEAWTDIN
jgi:hypothetical protein